MAPVSPTRSSSSSSAPPPAPTGLETASPATRRASSSPVPRPAPKGCSKPPSPASTPPATSAPARSSAALPPSARAPRWCASSTSIWIRWRILVDLLPGEQLLDIPSFLGFFGELFDQLIGKKLSGDESSVVPWLRHHS